MKKNMLIKRLLLVMVAGAFCLFIKSFLFMESGSDSGFRNPLPTVTDREKFFTNWTVNSFKNTSKNWKNGQSEQASTVGQGQNTESFGFSLLPVAKCLKRSELTWSSQPSLLRPHSDMCSSLLMAPLNGTDSKMHEIFSNATTWNPPMPHTPLSILNLVNNCTQFLTAIPFQTVPNSQEESDYPLAYVFVAHRNPGQTIRLFRMLYQPQNAYCITYDAKSDQVYIQAILAMASCFPSNVYVNPSPEPIYYFGYSILRSVMNCMRILSNSAIPWKYVQTVSWNDFPLRTNLEMVRIFKIQNGSQDSELLNLDTPDYVTYKSGIHGGTKRSIPPGGLTNYKGSFANSLSREFVSFMFTNALSIRFYESLEDSKCAEEFYWTTLVHNIWLGAPGAFPGHCEMYYSNAGEKKPFLSRFQVWQWDKGDRKCNGKWINLSCLYGIQDLSMLLKRMELVAHKLYEEYQPALLYCMEEWYWQRVCNGENQLDWKFYENLPSVRYHHLSESEKDSFVCTV